ncbi:MAG: type II 3-dehydroquinate dehydratase [Bacteroidetes bacterium RIFCSPLOWO2_02_FULL_36_8]|nr:MAG: type II 3-dehydroquinate dehydratase [Bacteroidetes bacterium RIFCSPLOWO2_02_FULL_36_8]OFY70721.1 MAG: type II 3-dehydroquinate dehydratase [Bacteroidetes bacterium RIFCSPLOWO2_12_FULL_37_12]
MKIHIINGPNLNLLGKREKKIYGKHSFDVFLKSIQKKYSTHKLEYFQSNIEGEIINYLQSIKKSDGIIINAGGFTHTSVAIHDALKIVKYPVIEVHISNITARESFRHTSLITPVSKGLILGFGLKSYELAVLAIIGSD